MQVQKKKESRRARRIRIEKEYVAKLTETVERLAAATTTTTPAATNN